MTDRSTNPDDFQELPVAVAVMRKQFPPDFEIAPHSHRRDQLIYAATGTMRIRTDSHTWMVPPERALYMPGGVVHSVAMRDPVEMRTLYIEPGAHDGLPGACVVITPTALLRELIAALLDEPADYAQSARGQWLGNLVLDEVCRGRTAHLSIPMPSDPRLLRVCEHVIAHPAETRGLEHFVALAGASERTLARLCQRELDMGFAAWRHQVRFHYAFEDLARGTPVGDVAEACGYASVSAFSAAFRKSFGHPPSRIMEQDVTGET